MCVWCKWACDACRGIKETVFQSVLERSCNKLISPAVPQCFPMFSFNVFLKNTPKPRQGYVHMLHYHETHQDPHVPAEWLPDSPAACMELNCGLASVFEIPWLFTG